jgi:hypothetical protein
VPEPVPEPVLNRVLDRVRHRVLSGLPPLPRFLRPREPALAAELTEERLSLARLERGPDGPRLAGWFVAEVPPGAVRLSPVHQNVVDATALAPLLVAARERLAPGGGPLALCLPDAAVRLTLIGVDSLPRSRTEQRDLVAWRMKKTLPYRLEEGHVGTQAFTRTGGKHQLLSVAVRRRVLAEHESLFERAGFEVGSACVSTLALAEQLDTSGGDVLLVRVGTSWFSFLVVGPAGPVLYRSKSLPDVEREGESRDLFVAGEVFPTLEYYRTRLGGGGLRAAWLAAEGEPCENVLATVAEQAGIAVQPFGLAPLGTLPPALGSRLQAVTALAARGVRSPLPALRPLAPAGELVP